ncbi:MAG: hypothetical protein A3K19_18280 [Lentisphaerae bacterium RIFOXYB12_FULL_65_16]|nr:MAG: hypothetical protein A3K18_05310 [Lentisphaerae bacterium RIFOXYA12_64_32]OGV93758.1 MAG: hypothetical protein A3K19_18280 [Lentisphaerae bacterium RIFOXYB12_FULL_65_16]
MKNRSLALAAAGVSCWLAVTGAFAVEPEAYRDACTAAHANAADPAAWVVHDLLTLEAATPGLQWDGAAGASRVLMSVFTSSWYYNRDAKATPTHPDLWATAGTELRDFYAQDGVTADNIALRTKQICGLPTSKAYDAIVELYVPLAQIFRPCQDPDITNPDSSTAFPEGVSAAHVTWFNSNAAWSYQPENLDGSYPWTQLGYTYDWGAAGTALADIRGLSEFVIAKEYSNPTVQTYAVYSLQSYLYTDRAGNFTITGPCDTVWAGSTFTPVDPETGYTVTLAPGAVMSGGQGIYASSAGAVIINAGTITGSTGAKYGVPGTEGISVLLEHGGVVENAGTITGNSIAIEGRADPQGDREDGPTYVVNANPGVLAGSVCAIRTGAANDHVTNEQGQITGNIETGSGDDMVQILGGAVNGDIDAGEGVDTLHIKGSPDGTPFVYSGHATGFESVGFDHGTIVLNGQVDGTGIRLFDTGRLQGTGRVVGTLSNYGVLAPGNSIGTFTVTGDYEQNGTLEIETDGTANDVLVVNGTVLLGEGSAIQVLQLPGHPLPDGYSMSVIDATGTITDEGVDLTSNSLLLHFTAEASRGDFVLECSRDSYGSVAATGDQAEVARALDSGVDGATGDLAEVLTELEALPSVPAAQDALRQLAPDAFEAMTVATRRGAGLFAAAFFDRACAVQDRRSPDGRSAGLDPDVVSAGPLLADADPNSPMVAQAVAAAGAQNASTSALRGFLSTYGAVGDQDTDGNLPGQDYSTAGTLFGVEFGAPEGFRPGLTGGYSYTHSSLDRHAGSGTIDSIRLGPSLVFAEGPLRAASFLTYGHHDIDVDRHIAFGGIRRTGALTLDVPF